jgi:hypothetical protein
MMANSPKAKLVKMETQSGPVLLDSPQGGLS